MISSFVRNLVALGFWLAITAAAGYASVQTVIANYLGTKSALELQGYEQQPLATDPLIGNLFGSFFPGATLAQFFALGVAIVSWLTFFGLCHIGGEIYELNEIRIDSQNVNEKGRARRRIYLWLITSGIVLIALILAVAWDLELFRFRTIAGAMTSGEPGVTPLVYPGLTEFLGKYDQQYISALIRIGPWGYLGVTLASCLFLEISFRQLSDRWARLMQPIDDMFESQTDFYGYDVQGQPVYDPGADVVYDIDGNPIAADDDDHVLDQSVLIPNGQNGQSAAAGASIDSNGSGPAFATRVPTSTDQPRPLFDIPPAPPPARDEPWPDEVDERPNVEPPVSQEVMGDPGNRISLAAAQADPARYRIDRSTGRIWDRKHWDVLHGVASEPETGE